MHSGLLGWVGRRLPDGMKVIGQRTNAGEMRKQSLRRREQGKGFLRQAESAMKESARAGGINQKLSRKLHRLSLPVSLQVDRVLFFSDAGEFDLIQIRHAQSLRLLHKILIEVRPIPVGVSDSFVRTGANHQLSAKMVVGSERTAKFVMIKGEAPL